MVARFHVWKAHLAGRGTVTPRRRQIAGKWELQGRPDTADYLVQQLEVVDIHGSVTIDIGHSEEVGLVIDIALRAVVGGQKGIQAGQVGDLHILAAYRDAVDVARGYKHDVGAVDDLASLDSNAIGHFLL